MTDDHDVRWHREAGRSLEQETEAATLRELAGRADDRNSGRATIKRASPPRKSVPSTALAASTCASLHDPLIRFFIVPLSA